MSTNGVSTEDRRIRRLEVQRDEAREEVRAARAYATHLETVLRDVTACILDTPSGYLAIVDDAPTRKAVEAAREMVELNKSRKA